MAAAMAVEMGFLGLTFAAACTGQPKGKVRPARPGALDSSSGAAGAWAGRHAHAKIPVCVRAQPALPRSDAPMHAGAQALLAVIAGPFFLMLGSALGGFAAHSLTQHEPALVGCTAFGVAALLYMVRAHASARAAAPLLLRPRARRCATPRLAHTPPSHAAEPRRCARSSS